MFYTKCENKTLPIAILESRKALFIISQTVKYFLYLWKFKMISFLLFRLEEDIFQYAKQNLAVVNVYIKDPVVTRILRDEKIPVIAFVANTGGKEFHRSGNV